MKKTSFLLFVLFLVGILTSCHKESAKTITFGDTKGMAISAYDSIMYYDDYWHPFLLDLDDDGIDDIKIQTDYSGPQAIGEYQKLTLYCLNQQTEIFADSVVKEIYKHYEPHIDTVGIHIISYETLSTCGKMAEDDLTYTSKLLEVIANDNDDPLDIDSHFLSGNSILYRENYDYDLIDYEENHHFTYYKAFYDCWNFPTDVEKYIGFKITKDDESRLGWLKIELIQVWDNGPVRVKLIETALQE